MKTSIRTHEGRVALVTGAGLGMNLDAARLELPSDVIAELNTIAQNTVPTSG